MPAEMSWSCSRLSELMSSVCDESAASSDSASASSARASPTLTTAPPGRIQSPLTRPGTPAHGITTSAERHSASSEGVW